MRPPSMTSRSALRGPLEGVVCGRASVGRDLACPRARSERPGPQRLGSNRTPSRRWPIKSSARNNLATPSTVAPLPPVHQRVVLAHGPLLHPGKEAEPREQERGEEGDQRKRRAAQERERGNHEQQKKLAKKALTARIRDPPLRVFVHQLLFPRGRPLQLCRPVCRRLPIQHPIAPPAPARRL
jgi:hypothetical protein